MVQEQAQGYRKKGFIQAKHDFVLEMAKFAELDHTPGAILDVGCGIGGTSRLLAQCYPMATVTGITLSKGQVERGTQLNQDRDLANCELKVVVCTDCCRLYLLDS